MRSRSHRLLGSHRRERTGSIEEARLTEAGPSTPEGLSFAPLAADGCSDPSAAPFSSRSAGRADDVGWKRRGDALAAADEAYGTATSTNVA